MEREEFDALLADESVATLLAEKYVPKADFDKVNGKKEQLLSEKKREQERAKKFEEELGKYKSVSDQIGQLGFDADAELAKFVGMLQKQQSSDPNQSEPSKSNDIKVLEDRMTIQKQTFENKIASMQKDYEKRLSELDAQNKRISQGWDSEKAENTLISEMNRIGVLPVHFKTLKMALRTRATVEENEDGVRGVLMLNENGLKVPATEYFDALAQSDEWKVYIAAPQTTGGGAVGGKGGRQNIDFNAERNKAMQNKDTRSSIELALLQQEAAKRQR